jgi:serine/threonine protein phosphatase PrpC
MLRVAEEFHGSHTGRQRPANEDALYARAPLFAVADGMGGAQAGEIASRIAVETLGAGDAAGGDASPEERLAELVRTANDRIHELSRADDQHAGMGTTMTAVLVGEEEITIAHVGDSRAYVLREGQLRRLTRDHSLVEEMLERGSITAEEASRHPQRSVITRAVGPEPHVEVDTHTARARDGDVLLICSDGLTTMIDEPFIERTLLDGRPLPEAGRALIDAANEAGGRDNITVVLFRLEEVSASRGVEQATSAGDETLRATDVHAAVEAEDRRGPGAPVATLERPTATGRLTPIPPPPERPAQRQRAGGQAGEGGRPRFRRALIALAILGFVGVPLALGTLIALRSVYFIGLNEQRFVTVYRGLPYELPLGIDLYQRNYESGVAFSQVPAGRRASLLDQQLRSQEDAYDLVAQLERGRLR